MEWKSKINMKLGGKLVAAVLIAVLSFGFVAEKVSQPEFYKGTVQALDEKKEEVLAVTAGLAATGTAISMLPGDTTTPIANQILDLSGWLVAVLCTIFLEKYLLTVLSYAVFKAMVPIICLLYLVGAFSQNPSCRMLCKKLSVMSLVFLLAIPVGVKVSTLVENTYQMSLETSADETDALILQMGETEDAGETEGILTQFFSKVKDSAAEAAGTAKDVLNGLIERVAVMVVTSCLIPIAVLLLMVWTIKLLFGIEVPVAPLRKRRGGVRSAREEREETL